MTGEKTLLRKLRRDRELTFDVLRLETGINISRLSRAERNLIQLSERERAILSKFYGVAPHRLQRKVA